MRGFRTDEKGRWSPVHDLYTDDDTWVYEVIWGVVVGVFFAIVLFFSL